MARTLADLDEPLVNDEMVQANTLANLGQRPRRGIEENFFPFHQRMPPDPAVDNFIQRFGEWNIGDMVRAMEEERNRTTRPIVPGSFAPDPLGFRGQQVGPGYFMLRRF